MGCHWLAGCRSGEQQREREAEDGRGKLHLRMYDGSKISSICPCPVPQIRTTHRHTDAPIRISSCPG
ncbi:hypothetical protein CCMA1212_001446 [Trichoderma ghanense]|uniref:Uncharacterized protein n=1 Tax=Trichoderma ghanense TaxID=65468 RepID=A0ABY2HF88_9HYPO